MPDLRTDTVTDWLNRLDPTRADDARPPPVWPIETRGAVPDLAEELGRVLDELSASRREALSDMVRSPAIIAPLQAILAQTGAARCLRLLHWLGESGIAEPQIVVALLIEGRSQEARALRATIHAFTRRILLARIFAPDRLAALQAAAEIMREQRLCAA